MTIVSRGLKWVVAGAFIVSATLALALPTPKDIEAAVNAGHYAQAESLLRDVLHDKPNSAKAHYELGQVLAHQQRYADAQAALQKAKELDPTLKFSTSPEKFNALLVQVRDLASAPSSSVVMAPSASSGGKAAVHVAPESSAVSHSDTSLSYVWWGIAGLVLLGLWLRRSAASQTASQATALTPTSMPPAPRGFGAQFTPHASSGAYAPQGYAPPASGGSTMAGAVVGGLAGVAAGYALSKALEGDHTASAHPAGGSHAADNGGYVPFDAPASPDLGTFDAGTGSGWDSADAGDASDDSW